MLCIMVRRMRRARGRNVRVPSSLRRAKRIGSLSIRMNELKHDSITRLKRTLTRLQKTTRDYFNAKEDFSFTFSCNEFGLHYTANNLSIAPPAATNTFSEVGIRTE
jgi:hypothetical protein